MAAKTVTAAPLDGKRAAQALAASLEEVRLRIIAQRDRLAELDRAPVSEAEALARLTSWTDGIRAAGLAKVDVGRFTGPTFHRPTGVDLADLLVGVLAGGIADTMAERIRAAYRLTPGLTGDERRKQIAAGERDLLDLELEEEAIIRNAEAAGLNILRRADSDPRAVLAAGKALP